MNLDGAIRDLDTLARELRLRPRQRAFVEHLQAGLPGWKAAQAAGYSGTEKARSVAASRPILEREVELRVADPVPALALLAKHYSLADGDERDRERTVQVQVNTLLQQADPESLRQAVLSQIGRPR